MTTFTNCHVVTGPAGATRTAFAVADGRVVDGTSGPEIDLGGRMVLPGLIDLQANGGGGMMFNVDPTVDCLRHIAEAHARFGTTALLATFVTDHLDRVDLAIAAVEDAIAQGVPGVAGIHIEGPFLAEAKKGAHDASKFLTLAPAHLDRITALRGGPTLVTVAPESASPEMIAGLCERGATVAIGHSNATLAEAQTAIDAGARGFTHLYNSMSPMVEMAPGCVGAALSDDRTWAGVIADGVHVEPEKLRIAYKCKGPEGLVLVTDAMPCAGLDEGSVFHWEGQAYVGRDGACWNEAGVLAGSALTMIAAVRNAVRLLGVPVETAAVMASGAPAAAMGMPGRGHLEPGARADFIVVDRDLRTLETWIGGARAA